MNQSNHKKMRADRLSNLPEGIILYILSRMNIKYAVQTCILSRRWIRLWTRLPTLNISTNIFENMDAFKNFILYLFIHHDASKLYTVSFTCKEDNWDARLVGAIIDYAVLNRVKDLSITSINCHFSTNDHCVIPARVLACQSMKSLSLNYVSIPELPRSLLTAALTSVHLNKVRVNISNDDMLLSCVNLESFVMMDCILCFQTEFVISCPKLVNLVLSYGVDDETPVGAKIKISTPKLVSFDFSAGFSFNFILSIDKCPALESVRMDLCIYCCIDFIDLLQRHTYAAHLIHFLKDLSSTKSLTLSADIIKILSEFPGLMENLPSPFHNLKALKLNKCRRYKSVIIPPEVKTFLFNGPLKIALEF